MSIEIDHAGKVALVTGSGAGIGREIALWLSRAGAFVVVNDIRSERAEAVVSEILDQGGVSEAAVADCRDDEAIDDLVKGIIERHGRLDIAVNNVGMIPPGRRPKPFVEYWQAAPCDRLCRPPPEHNPARKHLLFKVAYVR